MNIHSANLADKIEKRSEAGGGGSSGKSHKKKKGSSGKTATTSSKMQILTELKKMTAQELYSCSHAVPMLHDTAVELCVEKRTALPLGAGDLESRGMPESESFHSFVMDMDQEDSSPQVSIHFRSRVLNPVKLSLHRSQVCLSITLSFYFPKGCLEIDIHI